MDAIKEILERNPYMLDSAVAFSSNFILSNKALCIYNNLTEEDYRTVSKAANLEFISFGYNFKPEEKTFEYIGMLVSESDIDITFWACLNGHVAIKDLSCLQYMPDLKALKVDMFRENHFDNINRYVNLNKLYVAGDKISIKAIGNQQNLSELHISEKLRDVDAVGNLNALTKLTIDRMTVKDLDFLTSLERLTELHFLFGSATDYGKLPEIGKIETLSFVYVRNLLIEHLLPINRMNYLKKLHFEYLPHLTDLKWLENKDIETSVVLCRNFAPDT